MKSLLLTLFSSLVAVAVSGSAIRLAPIYSDGDTIADEFIVTLRQPESGFSSNDGDYSSYIDGHIDRAFGPSFGAREFEKFHLSYASQFSEAEIETLRNMPEVDYIEQNQKFYPVDTQENAPWGLDRIAHRDLPLEHAYTYVHSAGEGVDVYVIDTGINIEHEDFEGRAVWGFTAPKNDGDVDGNGHGTHVASTIGGKNYGVAKKVNLIAVKVLSSRGYGSTVDVIKGIDYASKSHSEKAAKKSTKSVANMSLGGGKSNAIEAAVERAITSGVAFGVAAGNENADACKSSPAGAPSPITVGATDRNDKRSYFSNYGTCVDIFAPGSDITAAWIGGKTAIRTISGTSMATPHVVGAMALAMSENDFSPAELKQYLLDQATPDHIENVRKGSPNLLLFTNPPTQFT